MATAAIYLNPEAYDTTGHQLMGRHAAGESFLKGFFAHARTDRLHLWNITNNSPEDLDKFLSRFDLRGRKVRWIEARVRGHLAEAGCVHLPSPQVAREAWGRHVLGLDRAYGVTGVTHTTATQNIMDALGNLLTAPCQPWDALICTSRAVRASVETELEAVVDYLKFKLDARSFALPEIATIPLGLDTSAFAHDPEARRALREENEIPADALVVLYVGRFSLTAKMNTAPMALALERAAQQSGREVWWVLSGWSHDLRRHTEFMEATAAFCPNVNIVVLDGRKPENRFRVWSVADLFLSLSDNVQETFGLTPVEAMAAGLPSVISDWNGYKDTVRHGRDGFRISSYTPRAGLGRDLAHRHAHDPDGAAYAAYVGATSQFTAVDVDEAASALAKLIEDPDLRRRMGASARERAMAAFDWRNVIPQYEALWGELEKRRKAAPAQPAPARNQSDNPWRLDPFRLFAAYPSEWLTPYSLVALTSGMTPDAASEVFQQPNVRFAAPLLPTPAEALEVVKILGDRRQTTVQEVLARFPPPRQTFIERGLVWMAKYGVVRILSRNPGIAE